MKNLAEPSECYHPPMSSILLLSYWDEHCDSLPILDVDYCVSGFCNERPYVFPSDLESSGHLRVDDC